MSSPSALKIISFLHFSNPIFNALSNPTFFTVQTISRENFFWKYKIIFLKSSLTKPSTVTTTCSGTRVLANILSNDKGNPSMISFLSKIGRSTVKFILFKSIYIYIQFNKLYGA